MFAVTTTDTLSIVDPTVIKKAPSSIPSCLDLVEPPTASSWSPDNTCFFIASASTVHKYELSTNTLKDVHSSKDTIQHLASKDRSTVIVGSGKTIHVVEAGSIKQTFDSHKTPITSLSLSNDNSLLSTTSLGAAHVYNIALGSHTVLKGLGEEDIGASIFHPHSRTRLLIGAGKQLLVYDTTRPSGPLKSITLTEGNIIAVACSPFSKTLVAAATSTGAVGLIDLEKEKALFRTLNTKTALTAIEFSPEGAAIYLGTENGKVLVVDLRGLDKPPKAVVVSDTGRRVETISVQKKAKPTVDAGTKTPTATTSNSAKTPAEPLPGVRRTTSSNTVSRSASKTAPSPARPRVGKAAVAASPVGRRAPSSLKEGTAVSSPVLVKVAPKKVLSPVRDPHGNSDLSIELDELAKLRRGKPDITPIKSTKRTSVEPSKSRPSASPRASTIGGGSGAPSKVQDAAKSRRARTLPTSSSTSAQQTDPTARKVSGASTGVSTSVHDRLSIPDRSPIHRPRTISSASRAATEDRLSAVSSSRHARLSATSASTSASRPPSSTSRTGSSLSPPTNNAARRSSATYSSARTLSRGTPSPDLPDELEPVTPIAASKQPKAKKTTGMGILGLGTPEVKKWIKAGQDGANLVAEKSSKVDPKGKGKTVGFKDDHEELEKSEEERIEELEHNLSLQISPRRPAPSGSGSSADSWAALAASTGSPNLAPNSSGLSSASPAHGRAASASAHDLLKTIVQDVMFDFQRETKVEMMGLHLDLLRMGRGWKTELRTLMDEYVGDLRDLREENERLRRENERLRRGWD